MTNLTCSLVMGKMKFLLESIPDSSSGIRFRNRFRKRLQHQNWLRNRFLDRLRSWFRNHNRFRDRNWFRNRLRNRNWHRNQNRLRNRSQFGHLHKKRRLDPMMLRIDSRKESKFTCKRAILMEIPGLISLPKLLNSFQELVLIPELIPILESISDSVTGTN